MEGNNYFNVDEEGGNYLNVNGEGGNCSAVSEDGDNTKNKEDIIAVNPVISPTIVCRRNSDNLNQEEPIPKLRACPPTGPPIYLPDLEDRNEEDNTQGDKVIYIDVKDENVY